LTAQRREKVVTMKWADVVGDTWEIASEEREKVNAGSLVLSQATLDIIRAQPRLGANPYVFAASHGGGPFNSFSQRKAELDAVMGPAEPWRLHDLRPTARSLMSRAGSGRTSASGCSATPYRASRVSTIRHSYRDEKADALRRLADLIERIVSLARR
jgi:integrase